MLRSSSYKIGDKIHLSEVRKTALLSKRIHRNGICSLNFFPKYKGVSGAGSGIWVGLRSEELSIRSQYDCHLRYQFTKMEYESRLLGPRVSELQTSSGSRISWQWEGAADALQRRQTKSLWRRKKKISDAKTQLLRCQERNWQTVRVNRKKRKRRLQMAKSSHESNDCFWGRKLNEGLGQLQTKPYAAWECSGANWTSRGYFSPEEGGWMMLSTKLTEAETQLTAKKERTQVGRSNLKVKKRN